MNYKSKDFFQLALKTERGKPANYHLFFAAQAIDQYPQYGVGSKGGGYIVVCEYCGKASWTSSPTKQFCDRTCKDNFHNSIIPDLPASIKYHGVRHRYCAYCGGIIRTNAKRIRQGESIYCSTKCASMSRGFKALWYVCQDCGQLFRGIKSYQIVYCSLECEERNEDNVHTPHLRYIEDMFDSSLNRKLERLHELYPKISITGGLRYHMGTNGMYLPKSADGYYQTPHQRRLAQLIKQINNDKLFK